MRVRDLIKQPVDIDVYDDVVDGIGIAFCGPMELTKEGYKKFEDVLNYEIILNDNCAIVCVDDEDGVWQKKFKKAKDFFYAAAGYVADSDYKKWFVEEA